MNYLKDLKPLTRQELATLNGGTTPSAGDCADFAATPEPGRYCKSE